MAFAVRVSSVSLLLLPLLRATAAPAVPVPWATNVVTHDGENATIPIPPSGVLFFLGLGPYNFAPTSVTVIGGLQGAERRQLVVTEQMLDLFYPIKVFRWDFGPAPADPPRQLRVEKSWTDKNVHPFWQKIIIICV